MPNSPEPTPKIFISYAWKNQTIAKRLQSDLKGDGVEVFVDYEKISGGDSLPERISAALEWCNTLVLLWSADSAQSYYVKQEWSSAFHLQKKIIVEGHTDNIGNDAYNLNLSAERARAVQQYLIANMNLAEERTQALGYGEERPIANNETEEGRMQNRRIDVVIMTQQ